jgi:hypothetical protein
MMFLPKLLLTVRLRQHSWLLLFAAWSIIAVRDESI